MNFFTAMFAMIRPFFGMIMVYSQQIAMGFVLLFGTFGTIHVFRREYGAAIRCGVFVLFLLSIFFGGLSLSFLQKTGGFFSGRTTTVSSSASSLQETASSSSIKPIGGNSGVYTGKGSFNAGGGSYIGAGGGSGSGGTLGSGLFEVLKNFGLGS